MSFGTAQTLKFLVTTFPGENVRARSFTRGLQLSHNGGATIAKETREADFHKLLLKILKLPEETATRYLVTDVPSVQVSDYGLSEESAKSLLELLCSYVGARSSGHTEKYAMAALRQRLIASKAETNAFLATLFEAFPDLPRDWVKEQPFQQNNSGFGNRFIVIDDEIAWSHGVTVGNPRVSVYRVDAQEFDPQLGPKFELAREEAKKNLTARGIQQRFGYVNQLEAEVTLLLRQKYQIRRRGFRELNPGIIID